MILMCREAVRHAQVRRSHASRVATSIEIALVVPVQSLAHEAGYRNAPSSGRSPQPAGLVESAMADPSIITDPQFVQRMERYPHQRMLLRAAGRQRSGQAGPLRCCLTPELVPGLALQRRAAPWAAPARRVSAIVLEALIEGRDDPPDLVSAVFTGQRRPRHQVPPHRETADQHRLDLT